jgi:crossover junction endodeoxyribonuclease RuvC
MTIVGIDPGKTGAMVLLYPDDSTSVHRVPLMNLRGKEQPAWVEWAQQWQQTLDISEPDLIVLEIVAARPGQGVTSMFNFGQTLGFVRSLAALADCRFEQVTPQAWKTKLGLLKSDKNASRELARRLMPSLTSDIARVKDDGVAEAALLAYYGRKYL